MGESELGVDEGHNKERLGREEEEEEEQKFVLNGHQIMVDEVNSRRFPSQQQESQLCLPRCGCYGIWGESLP